LGGSFKPLPEVEEKRGVFYIRGNRKRKKLPNKSLYQQRVVGGVRSNDGKGYEGEEKEKHDPSIRK